jgi:hypothetical protein
MRKEVAVSGFFALQSINKQSKVHRKQQLKSTLKEGLTVKTWYCLLSDKIGQSDGREVIDAACFELRQTCGLFARIAQIYTHRL